jgi:NAD(P)-dependent dehydrogenase (short-subunit alcohol dehydrogenase family)
MTSMEGARLAVAAAAAPLSGRTVVITGASDGIGAAAARRMAGLGARVIVAGRSAQKTAAVADSNGATALTGDFARLGDVRRIAGQILALCPRIDVLANNAGAMFPARMLTVDGNEMTFQVNHLAGFLLTGLLLPRLAATPGSRVLATSSMINPAGRIDLDDLDRSRRPYRQFAAYADSKLAGILFVRELARRVADGAAGSTGGAGAGPTATAFHPGMVASQFGRDTWYLSRLSGRWWNRFVARSPDQGAAPLVALAVRPDPHAVNGAYLHRFQRRERLLTARQARDAQLARQLWERSAELVGLPG